MMAGYGINAASSLASAYSQAEALKAQGDYQREMGRINFRFANLRGEDAKKRGEVAAKITRKVGKQQVGSARAKAAAQGIDADDGSSADVTADIEELAKRDAMTIRNNAWREAWGFKTQAMFDLNQTRMSANAANNAANATLLTGGLQALGHTSSAVATNLRVPQRKPDMVEGYSGSMSRGEIDSWFDRHRYGEP